MSDAPKAPAREGSLDAPVRHPIEWGNEDYDLAKVEAEMERQFDFCHKCRRCFNLRDIFPRLHDLIDESATGLELGRVEGSSYGAVAEACTLCDMHFLIKCPYVPPHSFDIDIPHLILRYRAGKRGPDIRRSCATNSGEPIGPASSPDVWPV